VRRALTWLIALPVIVVGSQVAHALAYWWAYPETDLRALMLERSGHGYLVWAPVAVGLLLAIELLALAVDVVDRVRSRPPRQLPPWAFLVIPALCFTVQEHVGTFPWWTSLEPSFWRGLVLQIPLGLVAYAVARLLSRAASAVADAVVARSRRTAARPARARIVFPFVQLPRLAPLAGAAAGRAPPVIARA